MESAIVSSTRPITAEDWKAVEKKLRHLYNGFELLCDGYRVGLRLQQVSQFRNGIRIYVNGVLEGKWFFEDCEERRRFFCPRTKDFLTAKEKKFYKKIYGTKKEYEMFVAERKYEYFEAQWTSFRALKSHLIKHNVSIEIYLKDGAEADGDQ